MLIEIQIFVLTIAFLFLLLFAYYFFILAQKPKLYCGNERMRRFLNNHFPILGKTYWPSFFLSFDGRFMTIFGFTKRMESSQKLPYKREMLELKDGGVVALDYLLVPEKFANSKYVAIILPGLMNSSQTPYIKSIALAIQRARVNVIVFNFRGVGGIPLRTPRSFNASNSEDFSQVLSHLKTVYPSKKFLAVGTSMGGMVLANYLALNGKEAKQDIKAAILLSTIYDCWSSIRSIETPGLNLKLINYSLGSCMKRLVIRNKAYLEKESNFCCIEKVLKGKTVRDFDENFTVPQFGFKDVSEYYKNSSIWDKIDKFTIPVFGLSSLDDTMSPANGLPFKQAEDSKNNFSLVTTKRGGHLAFLEGVFPTSRRFHFMERFVSQWIKAIVTYEIDLD